MNPESSSEWIKILFAYGPLGAMVVALMYGIWRASYWIADRVILPVVTEHVAMIKTVREVGQDSASNVSKIEEHVHEIKKTIVAGTAANVRIAKTVQEMATGDSWKKEEKDAKGDRVTPPDPAKSGSSG